MEPKSTRLREEKRDLSDPGANDTCDTQRATTQIYCRRDRASTSTRVPKDPYHSRKITTRRDDLPSSTVSWLYVKLECGPASDKRWGELSACNLVRLHRRKGCRELRAWVATGSYLSDRVRGYDPGNDLAQRDVDYRDYIPCQGRSNMATRAHLNLLESPQISEPLACRRAQPRKLGALLEHGH